MFVTIKPILLVTTENPIRRLRFTKNTLHWNNEISFIFIWTPVDYFLVFVALELRINRIYLSICKRKI
jgi:hypothetical protein